MKILGTWINIRANSFLAIKYHEAKMGEGAWEVISWRKIRACSSKKIATRHFTYYYILLFLTNKPSFSIKPRESNDFCDNLFTFSPFDILCVLKFIQYLYAFFISTNKILMRFNFVFFWRFTATKCYLLLFSIKD